MKSTICFSDFNTEKNVHPFIRKGFKKRVRIYLALSLAGLAILLMSSCGKPQRIHTEVFAVYDANMRYIKTDTISGTALHSYFGKVVKGKISYIKIDYLGHN